MIAAHNCEWVDFLGNHWKACACREVLKFSVAVLLIMQYKTLMTPYTVILFTEGLHILCINFSKMQQKSVAASTFHLFCLWIKNPVVMVSPQKIGDNGSAGILSLPSPAGVTMKEALRTSRTAQGQNLQMFPSVVCKEGVLLQCYCFSWPFSLGVFFCCNLSSLVLRIAEFPGRSHQNEEEGSFLKTFPFCPSDRRGKLDFSGERKTYI